jgi:hypothetical protein
VRYVPREQVEALEAAIAGYQRYITLTPTYADLIIAQTWQQQPARSKSPRQGKSSAKKIENRFPIKTSKHRAYDQEAPIIQNLDAFALSDSARLDLA